MTRTNIAAAPRGMTKTRPSASRKLLSRKAAENTPGAQSDETIEATFPPADPIVSDADLAALFDDDAPPFIEVDPPTSKPTDAQSAPASPASPAQPPAPSAWSSEDESAFQSLAARRKAAGYSRRGKGVGEQLIRFGTINPNPGTVVAVIAAIVAERGGSVRRTDLIAAMASAIFPSGKAKPTDADWCQGYIAGAVRNGFLAADAGPALAEVA